MLLLFFFGSDELRQEDQRAKGSAYQAKGREKTQGFQDIRLCKFQTEKTADSGKAAHRQRKGQIFYHLFDTFRMPVMVENMQRVIDGDAQYYRACPECNDRNDAIDKINGRQSKQGPAEYGNKN